LCISFVSAICSACYIYVLATVQQPSYRTFSARVRGLSSLHRDRPMPQFLARILHRNSVSSHSNVACASSKLYLSSCSKEWKFCLILLLIILGKTLTNQNMIQEDIKSRLKSGNACYHSVQNLLSFSLLSKI
jgi:Ni/Fe-hydrogenase subunit HybB-like protein